MTDHPLQALLRDATRLTQAGRLAEATAAIQRALGGAAVQPPPQASGEVLDGCVFETPAADRPVVAEFRAGALSHGGLTRQFKLYIPPAATKDQPLPLVVMLHGCTQNPDDFAAGTDMNSRAREQGFYVLYPAQAQDANPSRCWNWFKHSHQGQRGECALIAAMTRSVITEHGIDTQRVYIAGLSAGGAMAALVAAAYPELFAAAGVHSGLAAGAAKSLPEAMAAMQGSAILPQTTRRTALPVIVFHGDQDTTVHPRNGEQVIAASTAALPRLEQGRSPQGRRYTRSIYPAGEDRPAAEHWLLHGVGHAWSGGSAAGSYTDASGPDASGEMLRFFFEHPRRAGH